MMEEKINGLNYRYENKYIVSERQSNELKSRLEKVLRLDPNAGNKKMYSIRSVYFDDYDDSAYQDVIDGVCERSKWRIRMYGTDSSVLKLERKSRKNDLIRKESAIIKHEDVVILLKSHFLKSDANNMDLKTAFCKDLKTKGLRPKVVVEYDRIPFVYDFLGIRVTLDTNISASSWCTSFFDCDMPKRSVLQNGMSVLEVKYNEFLPQNIRDIIFIEGLCRTSFSKYTMGRDAMGIIS